MLSFEQWSYGVTLWEVYSRGAEPYWGIATFDLLKFIEKRNGRLDIPESLDVLRFKHIHP